jgi:anthranilate synthase component 1
MSLRAEVVGDVDLLNLHRRHPRRYPFLLQSVAGHAMSGRYDLLFAFPGESLSGPGFFSDLDKAFAVETVAADEDRDSEPPFIGGWFLLLGYEAARFIEPSLSLPASPYGLPDALAVRCRGAIIRDRNRGTLTLIAEQGAAELQQMQQDLAHADQSPDAAEPEFGPAQEEDPQRYLDGVRRILDYLQAGDIFQANLSRHWRLPLIHGTPADVYARLRQANPAPFAGLACWNGSAVVSSSPERLLRIDGSIAETRPIAGTRPRGGSEHEDRVLRRQLLDSLKERAEHVMLIDLERNDLGRVCEPGSIEVNELMTVESYTHVHHIVSNVRGRLRAGVGPGTALSAVFPGGTITGCPKIRSMEILAELEATGRGPYTGAMGYLSRCGKLDTNILIRSLILENGWVHWRAGAGIVADSDPQAELAETRTKARGLLRALGQGI